MDDSDLPHPSPDHRWTTLADRSNGAGYLSVYLSDPLARYPVRHITRKSDNKSDPNIETGTYGLFSTCERPMRGRTVRDGRTHLFFVTKHGKLPRALTGYYEVGWFAESTGGARTGDYALAARTMRWITPFPLSLLPASLRIFCERPFRTCRPVEAENCTELRKLINTRSDMTSEYVAEINRLELYAQYCSGYSYPSWGRSKGFSWSDAELFLGHVSETFEAPSSSTGRWRCIDCSYIITNKALLRSCPICQKIGTLHPEGSR